METKDITRICLERFLRWLALLTQKKCLPIAVIGLSVNDPLEGIKVFAFSHTNRVALHVFLGAALKTMLTDDALIITDADTDIDFSGCTS